MKKPTTLDLNDRQFFRVRLRGPARNLLFFQVVEIPEGRSRPRLILSRETRLDLFENLLRDEVWRSDFVASYVYNTINEARTKAAGGY